MNWKKIVKGLLVLLLVLGPAGRVEAVPIAQAEERLGNYTGPSSGTAQDDNVKASLDLLHSKVGGGVDNIGTGNAFYVDSNVVSEGAGTSWIGAKDTLDEAVDLCTNNNGDVIYVAAGHNENWTGVDSADLDVIGITVIGLGKGSDRPRFDYDDVDAELVIAAANVKIYNLTFMPGYAEVVHAIEIEDDADGSIIDSCEFFEGETAGTDEFLNAIQLALASDDIIISNCVVTETADGADSWLDASTGIVDNLAVVGNRVWGDYDLGGIYTNKACTNCYVADNAVTNLATGIAAIVFSGNATGTMVDNYASSDTPGTIVDPGYMQQAGNVEADEGANLDSDTGPAWAVSAPAGTGNYPDNVESESLFSYIMGKGSTAAASTFVNTTDSLEALRDHLDSATVLGGLNLDHLLLLDGTEAYPEQCATDSVLAKLIADDAAANPNTYNNTTDSLEAIANHVQTLITTGAGTGTSPTGITNESIMAFVLAKGATATASTFNNTTDSLEAIADHTQTLITTAAGTGTAPTGVTSDSILAYLMSSQATAAASDFVNTTDSLQAIADHVQTLITTGAGTDVYPSGVTNESIIAFMLASGSTATASTFNNTTDSLQAIRDVVGETYTDDAGTDDLDDVYSHLKLIFDVVAGTATAGEVFYVDSGGGGADTSGYGVSWAMPCLTIDYAEGLATASRGDIILVAPGHAGTITAAGSDLTMAKAGVKVIGLGVGRNRPVITFTTDAGADIECDNSVAFYNMVFDMTGIDAVTGGIDVDAADVQFHDCEFVVADAGGQVQYGFTLDAAAHRFLLKNCRFVGGANDGPDAIINLVATAPQEIQFIDCWFEADCDDAVIFGTGTPTDMLIQGCHIVNLDAGEHAIEMQGNSTGVIKDCTIATDTYATGIDPGTCRTFNTLWYDSDVPGDAVGIPVLAISAGGATQVAASDLALIQTEVTSAIEADLLHFVLALADGTGVAPASVVEDSILAKIMGDDAAAVATTFDNTTDSLEALGIKTEQIAGGDGVATFPAAAQAADTVSLAEVLRYVQEKQVPRMELQAYADLTGYDTAAAFDVTGDVMLRVVGVVGATAISSSGGACTLSIGTTEDDDSLIAATTIPNGAGDFAATDVWVDNNPEDDSAVMGSTEWQIVGGGADIILTRSVDDIAQGTLTLYCWWVPLSADGDVTATP